VKPEEAVFWDQDLVSRLVVGIGEVAEITGVPQRQLRYWEEKGYIQSVSGTGGTTRRYDFCTIKKVILIKELMDDGYTLAAAAKKVEMRLETLVEAFKKLSAGQSEPGDEPESQGI
jgi:DNA-binding transcriptional MerR regulator